jgi:hypothetical protein
MTIQEMFLVVVYIHTQTLRLIYIYLSIFFFVSEFTAEKAEPCVRHYTFDAIYVPSDLFLCLNFGVPSLSRPVLASLPMGPFTFRKGAK